jgi:hypothetical protein
MTLRAAPLVSVGLPTYRRPEQLDASARSVLDQSVKDLELVISDNASGGRTDEVLAALATDPRVRVLRQDRNRGATANFNAVIAALCGRYRMLLADDDCLSRRYVERCLATLRADPGLVLVAGEARWPPDVRDTVGPRPIDLSQDDACARVRHYLAEVTDNSVFFGLAPATAWERVPPLRNVVGNDWLFVLSFAVQGRVRTLPDVWIERASGGASDGIASLVQALGVPPAQRRAPYLFLARHVAEEIVWRSPAARAELAPWRRAALAMRSVQRPLRIHQENPVFPPSRVAALALRLLGSA